MERAAPARRSDPAALADRSRATAHHRVGTHRWRWSSGSSMPPDAQTPIHGYRTCCNAWGSEWSSTRFAGSSTAVSTPSSARRGAHPATVPGSPTTTVRSRRKPAAVYTWLPSCVGRNAAPVSAQTTRHSRRSVVRRSLLHETREIGVLRGRSIPLRVASAVLPPTTFGSRRPQESRTPRGVRPRPRARSRHRRSARRRR